MKTLYGVAAICSLLAVGEARRTIPAGLLGDDDNPLVTLYMESWAVWDRNFKASNLDRLFVNRGMPFRKFAINHAFSVQNRENCHLRATDQDANAETPDEAFGIVGWGGPWTADGSGAHAAGLMGGLMAIKKARPDVILLPSIGGWSRSQEFHNCIQPGKREMFADGIIEQIRHLGFDGVDLDWEYPGCEGGCGCQGEEICHSTPNVASHEDWDTYKSFLTYLRGRLDTEGDRLGKYLYITMALGMGPDILQGHGKWDRPTPFDFLCADDSPVDWMNLMTYDYFGPWAALTGPLSPLKDTPGISEDDTMNVKFGLDYVKQHCKNMKKLTMGLGTYGKSWAGVPKQGNPPGLWQQATQNPPRGPGTWEAGTVSMWEIVAKYRRECTDTFDEVSEAATLYCDSTRTFIAYESGEVWKRKMAMARQYGMSGAIIWAAGDFEFRDTEVTGELMGGLFSGWTGRPYTVPPSRGNTRIEILTRWPSYPCPILMETSSASVCANLGAPKYTFPSDETVNLAGSHGGPTSPPAHTTTAGTTRTPAPPVTTKPQTTTTSPAPTGNAVQDCRAIISSPQPEYTADCQDKCAYYHTSGSCHCASVATGRDLAGCISHHHGYCTVAGGGSPPTSAPTVAPPPSGGGSGGSTCESLVKGIQEHWDSACQEKCKQYGPGGELALWCPQNSTPQGVAACITSAWATMCTSA